MGSDAPLVDIAEDKLVDFETKVMTIPQYDPSNPRMISQGPSLCIFNKADPQEVLASWLFTQYLLTNEVQVAYAKTEGYVPVTYKAQQSAEYRDYVSRAGEDNDTYYIFVANPMTQTIEYPLEYCYAFTDEGSTRQITVNHHGKAEAYTLNFNPMESILLQIDPDGIHPIDLNYTPQKLPTD